MRSTPTAFLLGTVVVDGPLRLQLKWPEVCCREWNGEVSGSTLWERETNGNEST